MDQASMTKTIGGAVLAACVMGLALTHMVDGAAALDALKWIGGTFILATGGVAIANKLTANRAPGGGK
jgi:hypothetical protein